MCDYSGKIIAWLDHELPEGEFAAVERHLRTCAECRGKRDPYARVSRAFDAHCDAVRDSARERKMPGKARPWAAALSAAAAAGLLLMLFSGLRAERPRRPLQASVQPAAIVPEPTPRAMAVNHAVNRPRRKHGAAAAQSQNADWMPAEPSIEIAIPAEAMFPPGAVPEGVDFTADVSMAADWSVQGLSLRPRLAGF